MRNDKTLDYIVHYKIPQNLPIAESALIDNGYVQKNKTQGDGAERETGKTYSLLLHGYALLLYTVLASDAETLAEKISSINQTLDEKIDFFPASIIKKFTRE